MSSPCECRRGAVTASGVRPVRGYCSGALELAAVRREPLEFCVSEADWTFWTLFPSDANETKPDEVSSSQREY